VKEQKKTKRASAGTLSLFVGRGVWSSGRKEAGFQVHLSGISWDMKPPNALRQIELRKPSDPSPPPIREPIEPQENPDVPIREPDPEEPNEI
jgi:hypothetical protein